MRVLGNTTPQIGFGVGPRGSDSSGAVERRTHRLRVAEGLVLAESKGAYAEGRFGRAPVRVRAGAVGRVARRAPFGFGCSAEEHALYGRCLDGLCGTRGDHEKLAKWYHGDGARRGRELELKEIMRLEDMTVAEL